MTFKQNVTRSTQIIKAPGIEELDVVDGRTCATGEEGIFIAEMLPI